LFYLVYTVVQACSKVRKPTQRDYCRGVFTLYIDIFEIVANAICTGPSYISSRLVFLVIFMANKDSQWRVCMGGPIAEWAPGDGSDRRPQRQARPAGSTVDAVPSCSPTVPSTRTALVGQLTQGGSKSNCHYRIYQSIVF